MFYGSKTFSISPAEKSAANLPFASSIISTKLVDYNIDSDLALLTMGFKRQADSYAARKMAVELRDTVVAFALPAEFESLQTDLNFILYFS